MLHQISRQLVEDLADIEVPEPVTCTYNPLIYAAKPFGSYLERFGQAPKEVVLVGMNPGPWGMVQTGVPFGDIPDVRDWLEIEVSVDKPPVEHPKRRIVGLDCSRVEVSGKRLWGWARGVFGTPEAFAERFFVWNYCPLVFMADTGRNIPPDKLRKAKRTEINGPCEKALRATVVHLGARFVIGVGAYAERRIRASLGGLDVTIGSIMHPSPANPAANKGWAEHVSARLRELGITLPEQGA